MPERPWVTPKEVREYSEIKSVQERTDARLVIDISRAEQYVISYTGNDFSGYKEIPQDVKTAVILLAENYGYNSAVSARGLKSETFDDYSYTADTSLKSVDGLDIKPLLEGYMKDKDGGSIVMRLRRL